MDKSEKSYKNEGLIFSIIFHALLFGLFFFLVISTPDPPLTFGGSGIELNYGTVDEGYGDIQTKNEANISLVKEETAPSNHSAIEKITPEPIKEPTPEPIQPVEKVLTSDDPESIDVKEAKKEKEIVKKESPKPVVEKKEQPQQQTVVKAESIMKATSNGKIGTEEKIGGNSNGDKPGKVGDQGNPQGSVDAKALYGNLGTGGNGPGGSGNGTLQMAGWRLVGNLNVDDKSSETGKIVFEIKVDEDGELTSVKPLESTVSPSLVKVYEKRVWEEFAVIKEGRNVAPVSVGRIIYNIRAK